MSTLCSCWFVGCVCTIQSVMKGNLVWGLKRDTFSAPLLPVFRLFSCRGHCPRGLPGDQSACSLDCNSRASAQSHQLCGATIEELYVYHRSQTGVGRGPTCKTGTRKYLAANNLEQQKGKNRTQITRITLMGMKRHRHFVFGFVRKLVS